MTAFAFLYHLHDITLREKRDWTLVPMAGALSPRGQRQASFWRKPRIQVSQQLNTRIDVCASRLTAFLFLDDNFS